MADAEAFAGFTDREKAAIALADELTVRPPVVPASEERLAVSPATRQRVLALFNAQEITELVTGIAVFNFMNRFNRLMNPDIDMEAVPDEVLALLG